MHKNIFNAIIQEAACHCSHISHPIPHHGQMVKMHSVEDIMFVYGVKGKF